MKYDKPYSGLFGRAGDSMTRINLWAASEAHDTNKQ